jgi:NAD(P)-dependent dehydrogenase (short-subunit alcohol dehydrogenase family)
MKTILVTGGSKGIGKSIVFHAASKKYNVIFTYNRSIKEAKKICQKIKNNCFAIKADLSKNVDRNKIFKILKKKKIKLDCLVNNAAFEVKRKEFSKINISEVKKVYEVNVFAVYVLIQKSLKFMKKNKWSSIINISSTSAKFGGRLYTHYAPTKAAIENLTIGLSRELSKKKIRVLNVAPGIINTKKENRLNKSIIKTIPNSRLGTAEEVAKLVIWLTSDDAEYINGSTVTISGGR